MAQNKQECVCGCVFAENQQKCSDCGADRGTSVKVQTAALMCFEGTCDCCGKSMCVTHSVSAVVSENTFQYRCLYCENPVELFLVPVKTGGQ